MAVKDLFLPTQMKNSSEVVPGLDKASYHGDVWESGGIACHIHFSTRCR